MTDQENQQAVEKTRLETEVLRRQLSWRGLLMAWLQATSVPVALLGAILAFFIGFGQLRQSADSQAAERFDKTLTRIASKEPDERMTGVTGLELFLSDPNLLLRKQALEFLTDRLALETDVRVSGAILDVLADLKPGQPSQEALDAALRSAIERNRSLTKSIVGNWPQRVGKQQQQILATFKLSDTDRSDVELDIPSTSKLRPEQYLALLNAARGPFEELDPADDLPLKSLTAAIQTLLARGATSGNLSAIYCVQCDFTAAESLDGIKFDAAYLSQADFSRTSLRGASFHNADIGGATFFGSDLTNADLRVDHLRAGFANKGFNFELPLLECAKLAGADLTGQPLVLFVKEYASDISGGLSYDIKLPRMTVAQLDASTKLEKFTILTAVGFDDAYIKQHMKDLDNDRLNPLTKGYWAMPDFRRLPTSTLAVTDVLIDAEMLKHIGGDAFMLRGFIDAPNLKALPLYANFIERIAALAVPSDQGTTSAKAWSDKAAKSWTALKPLSCSEKPTPHGLLFDIGDHSVTSTPD